MPCLSTALPSLDPPNPALPKPPRQHGSTPQLSPAHLLEAWWGARHRGWENEESQALPDPSPKEAFLPPPSRSSALPPCTPGSDMPASFRPGLPCPKPHSTENGPSDSPHCGDRSWFVSISGPPWDSPWGQIGTCREPTLFQALHSLWRGCAEETRGEAGGRGPYRAPENMRRDAQRSQADSGAAVIKTKKVGMRTRNRQRPGAVGCVSEALGTTPPSGGGQLPSHRVGAALSDLLLTMARGGSGSGLQDGTIRGTATLSLLSPLGSPTLGEATHHVERTLEQLRGERGPCAGSGGLRTSQRRSWGPGKPPQDCGLPRDPEPGPPSPEP